MTEREAVRGGAVVVDDVLGGRRAQARLVERGDDPGEAPLERRKLRYGLVTLCVGGGMGIATIVERL